MDPPAKKGKIHAMRKQLNKQRELKSKSSYNELHDKFKEFTKEMASVRKAKIPPDVDRSAGRKMDAFWKGFDEFQALLEQKKIPSEMEALRADVQESKKKCSQFLGIILSIKNQEMKKTNDTVIAYSGTEKTQTEKRNAVAAKTYFKLYQTEKQEQDMKESIDEAEQKRRKKYRSILCADGTITISEPPLMIQS